MYGREHHSREHHHTKAIILQLKKKPPSKSYTAKKEKRTGLSYAHCAEKQWLLSLGVEEDGKLGTDWDVSPLHIRLRVQEEMSVEVELNYTERENKSVK